MKNTSAVRISRRDFLKFSTNALLALSGLLGLGGLIRYLSYQADPTPPTEFDIGPAMNYPLKSRTVLEHIPAVIVHDDTGLHAISLACTHLGCAIEERNFGFECPCHSSRFDFEGRVLKGPAATDLRKLRVTKSGDGNLHVFTT
jgi:cytochrome b6-f complex iron-sulfur subunit